MKQAFLASATCVAMLLAAPAASALNARTWISGKGVDQAGCGPIANPCRSLQYAHDQTSAGGEIDVLDGAGYGSLVITKAISIVNDGAGLAGVLGPADGNAIAINAASTDDVLLKGLTIEGARTAYSGVDFASGRKLAILDCFITGFTGYGIRLKSSAPLSRISISSTKSLHNIVGLALTTATSATATTVLQIDNVVTNNNQYGIMINAQNAATNVAILNTVASNNEVNGVNVEGGGGFLTVMLDGLTANSNLAGVYARHDVPNRSRTYLSRSTIMGNSEGINIGTNPIVLTFNDNRIVTNNTDVVGGTLQSVGLR